MKKLFIIAILLITMQISAQVKIKDLCDFSGASNKQLIGYGLVIGLDGTGDGGSSQVTIQSIKNMMNRFGISVPTNKIRPNNVAAVMLTADLDPFAKSGSKFDVSVASISDAKSLEGGTLLMTQMMDSDENICASVQGALSIGGFNTGGNGSKIRKNYTLVGRIPNGGKVLKGNFPKLVNNNELMLNLRNSDFTTAQKISNKINESFSLELAIAEDASTISILVDDKIFAKQELVKFISEIENLEVLPEFKSKVVINEKTGTIVAGGNVKIAKVAIAHGNLIIEISSEEQSIQLGNVIQTSSKDQISALSEEARMVIVDAPSVQDLAQTLNSIQVSSRDLISIFQAIKVSGALHAELVII